MKHIKYINYKSTRLSNILFVVLIAISGVLAYISTPYLLTNGVKLIVDSQAVGAIALIFTAFMTAVTYFVFVLILNAIVRLFGIRIKNRELFHVFIISKAPIIFVLLIEIIYVVLFRKLFPKDITAILGILIGIVSQFIMYALLSKDSRVSKISNIWINIIMFLIFNVTTLLSFF